MKPCNPVQAKEVAWYYFKGRYRDRVRLCGRGYLYIIGDWSWNLNNPKRPEQIETLMKTDGVYSEKAGEIQAKTN